MIDTLRKLLPENLVTAITSFSEQSLHYMKEDDFIEKIMMMGEALHNDTIEGYIRQMQSEGELTRLVAMKNPKTNELESRKITNKVQMSFMMSSTALTLHPENASRCLILHTDESAEQTKRVLEFQRKRRTIKERLRYKQQIPEIIKKHISAQRLLQRVPIYNTVAPLISFPKSRPTMRRSQEHFLILIETVALLRQFQKEQMNNGIEVDGEDYSPLSGVKIQ